MTQSAVLTDGAFISYTGGDEMALETIDDIRARIAELKAEDRANRIARGLPPERPKPPTKFINEPLAYLLAKELDGFYKIAVQYSAIIASGGITSIDTDKLSKYAEVAELLSRGSIGYNPQWRGSSVLIIIRVMDQINQAIKDRAIDDAEISLKLRILSIGLSGLKNDAWYPRDWRECRRLQEDSVAYENALRKAREHYETIKHLYEE